MIKRILVVFLLTLSLVSLVACGNKGKSEYDKDGRMILNLRNLYFNDWAGGDSYTKIIEDKFNVSITPTNYSWSDWDNNVSSAVNSNDLTDVFHFDVDSYNFANSYQFWAEYGITKPLPTDLTKWPNLKAMLEKTSNIDNFYIDGKLYGIPVAKNIAQEDNGYSPFTYVYRRDWAKQYGVYQENDVYTWEQFVTLLNTFYQQVGTSGDFFALADVEWGYPSIMNFYKDAPHCFTMENNKVVSTYTTNSFLQGLDVVKDWASGAKKIYGYDQYRQGDGEVAKQFYAGRVGVFYENLTLTNYTTLRKKVAERAEIQTKQQLDDATAIMKVMGPENSASQGKFCLEGNENWFSISLFSSKISDDKLNKILDIIDWLLSEEGTMMAIYGIEGYDYDIDPDTGEVTLRTDGWELDMNGNYVEKYNGAKYLRYMATLGYDTSDRDPLVDQESKAILDDWYAFMDEQYNKGNLKVLVENPDVKWMSTPTKANSSGKLLTDAVAVIKEYTYNTKNLDEYKRSFTSKAWTNVLKEINDRLGK